MRKKILFFCTVLFCTLTFAGNSSKTLTLENDHIRVVFDSKNGALLKMTDKNSGWEIMQREILAQSFELLLPFEGVQMTDADHRYNVIKGLGQRDPVIEKKGNKITFTWNGMKSGNMDKPVDITFNGEVELTDKGLEFSGNIINRSEYPVEYISWPCIGEVTIPDKTQPLYHNTRNDTKELFPHFFNQHGYWGVDYPTSTYVLPEKSYVQVNDRERGFMIYNHKAPKYMTIASFELIPGYEARGVNPYANEIDGEMVRIQFKANHILYNRPGDTSTLDPIRLITYKGDWTKGVDIYRNDRIKSSVVTKVAPKWLTSPLTWRKAGIGNGSDLIRYAEESAKLGVDVLLVDGWYRNTNGHITEVDGLEQAIAKCHELGLRIVLATDWTSVDRHATGYMEHFRKYVMVDPFDMPYNFTDLCPNTPEVQQWVKNEWLQLPALHIADGYMNNDHNHDNKTFMCFDTKHNHRFGEPTINGMMKIDADMAKAIASTSEKAAMGYGFIEAENDIYDGYQVNVNDEFYLRHRYLSPNEPIIVKTDVRNARKTMNKALLYRMNIAYDLNFFSNNLSDYPHIVEYGNAIKALRKRYPEYIWNTEFDGHNGAIVNGENIEYSVFENKNGKRAIVVANMSNENTKATVSLNNSANLLYVSPEAIDIKPFNGTIEIAPLSVIIIMEK